MGVIGTGPAPPSIAVNGPGSFTFELEVTSSNGCTDDQSRTLVLASLPQAAFAAESACMGNPVILDGSSSTTDAAQGGAITDFAWTVNGEELNGETTSF
ncbi:MAG TPA: hypothetical protein DHV07_07450, partial [Flavobacteriales bacterium]|nr:hypothetical protein [Flavobacteriales bacterium]